jgi:hypothetical protein
MANFSKRTWCIGVAGAFLISAHVSAQDERVATLAQRIRSAGEMRQGYVVLSDSQRITAVAPAAYVDAPAGKDGALVGRVPLPQSTSTPLQILYVMLGAQGEVQSAYQTLISEELPPAVFLASSALRDRFVERRGVLRQMQASSDTLDTKLKDLQADADAIANVHKLVDAEDEIHSVRAALARVKAAQEGIQQRVAYLRSLPPPSNAQRREAELVQQLGDLSKSLAVTETAAVKKISSATSELQSKLRDIEDTKEEHIGLLEEELLEAQRARPGAAAEKKVSP